MRSRWAFLDFFWWRRRARFDCFFRQTTLVRAAGRSAQEGARFGRSTPQNVEQKLRRRSIAAPGNSSRVWHRLAGPTSRDRELRGRHQLPNGRRRRTASPARLRPMAPQSPWFWWALTATRRGGRAAKAACLPDYPTYRVRSSATIKPIHVCLRLLAVVFRVGQPCF